MFADLLDAKNYAYYNRQAVRAAKRAKKQRLMKEIFGYDLVRSDYLAFDPFYDFEITNFPITARNRMVKKTGTSGYSRKRFQTTSDRTWDMVLYAAAPGVNRRHPYSMTNAVTSKAEGLLPSQPIITGFVHDTTKRTRGSLSDFGEAEMFLPRIFVPNENLRWKNQETEIAGTDLYGPYKRIDQTFKHSYGRIARITQTAVDSYLNLERTYFSDMARAKGDEMLPDALPSRREFSFLREAGELKDIPHLLQASVSNARNLYQNGTFNPSDQYLSQEFGWEPLVKAVVDLVRLPDRIVERVNYLLKRLGKDTTFRSARRDTSAISSAQGFTFDALLGETLGSTSHSAFRTAEWRMALNYGVRFPILELPKLKEWLASQLWGARFRPDDFYNLIPWSWLVDWFTGLGNYVEAVSSIADDTSVANYGFLTYDANGFVLSSAEGKVTETRSTRFNGGPITTLTKEVKLAHTAVLRYKYLRRVDVTSLSSIKRTWMLDELSSFQASILGALAFKR